MFPGLAAVFVFAAVLLGVVAVPSSPGRKTKAELRLQALKKGEQAPSPTTISYQRRTSSSLPLLRIFLNGVWGENLASDLERANLSLRAGEYLSIRALSGTVLFFMALLLWGMGVGLLLGLALGLLGFMLPAFYLRSRIRRRRDAINGQLPEFLRLVANALRAGFALLQAFDSAARQLPPPLSEELDRILADTNLGADTEDSLRDLADRIGSYEIKMVVTAILVQRSTGGNLSEVLDKVAETMDDRDRIRGEVRAATAQQRLTGNILSVYPAALAGLFFLLNPDLMSVLWTESAGIVLLVIGVTLQLIGFLVIRRMLAIDF